MEIDKWRKISEQIVYDGYRKVRKTEFELPDGSRKNFDILIERDFVNIMAINTNNEVILVKQFRPGREQIYTELPAGAIDNNEGPEAAAKRELLEETGYIVGSIIKLNTSSLFAYSSSQCHAYLARECKKVGEPTLEDEFLEVIEKPIKDFRKMLESEETATFTLATGYAGLALLDRIKTRHVGLSFPSLPDPRHNL